MATILRSWSYRYPWFYGSVARLAALTVGGYAQLHRLPLQGIRLQGQDRVLDLCCGPGEATSFLLQHSQRVTGLDASPRALAEARRRFPQTEFVEGFAQAMPFPDASFEVVHISLALHEWPQSVILEVLREIGRVLTPDGLLLALDLHTPQQAWIWPGLAAFLLAFETETAWDFLGMALPDHLTACGFGECRQALHAFGSLQVLQASRGQAGARWYV
ncbi:MAG: class I SAM-dependent methyltransferase [Cyanobacteriota bacterium]|nr:class I SAM-dependent methyltransferase [Cyanobacteriota bacterium]